LSDTQKETCESPWHRGSKLAKLQLERAQNTINREFLPADRFRILRVISSPQAGNDVFVMKQPGGNFGSLVRRISESKHEFDGTPRIRV
jgi:hypothetical protein